MKITNNYALPEWLYQSIASSIEQPDPNVIRVTELINPPLERWLKFKYWDSMEKDAVEYLTPHFGTAWHQIHEKFNKDKNAAARLATDSILIEERMNHEVSNEMILSGKFDRFERETETIHDVKLFNTKSFKIGSELKESQIAQQNIYRWLLWKTKGILANKMVLEVLFRDWFIINVEREYYKAHPTYHPIPYYEANVPIWSMERTELYIEERLERHYKAINTLPDIEISRDSLKEIECSDEDKWKNPDCWAVCYKMKNGDTRAYNGAAKFSSESIALDFQFKLTPARKSKSFIEFRVSKPNRCNLYCSMRSKCPYPEAPIVY